MCVSACACACVRVNLKASYSMKRKPASLLPGSDLLNSFSTSHHCNFPVTQSLQPFFRCFIGFLCYAFIFFSFFFVFFLLSHWRPSTAGASTPCCTGVDCCLFIFSVTEAIESGGSKSKSIFLSPLSQRRVHCFVLMDNKLFGMKWLCDSQSGPFTCG